MNPILPKLQGRSLVGDEGGFVHRLDPRVKILVFFAIAIVSVATSAAAWRALTGYALLLATLTLFSRISIFFLIKRCLFLLPLILLTAGILPFTQNAVGPNELHIAPLNLHLSRPGCWMAWNVFSKSVLVTYSMILLSATTSFPDLLRGLEELRIPPMLVHLAGFVHRYGFLIAEEAGRMKRAADSRGFRARRLRQSHTIGQWIGSLFLRSYERGERIYAAMTARGFSGKSPGGSGSPWRRTDLSFLAASWGILAVLRIFGV